MSLGPFAVKKFWYQDLTLLHVSLFILLLFAEIGLFKAQKGGLMVLGADE